MQVKFCLDYCISAYNLDESFPDCIQFLLSKLLALQELFVLASMVTVLKTTKGVFPYYVFSVLKTENEKRMWH